MDKVETVKIKTSHDRGYIIINKCDLKEGDVLYAAPVAKVVKKTVRKRK